MQIIDNFTTENLFSKPLAMALGNFDGVHRGHQALIKKCVQECQDYSWHSAVFTLHPHPSMMKEQNEGMKLLNTIPEKAARIEKLAVNYLLLFPFNKQTAAITPEDFIKEYLVDRFHVKKIYVGFNYSFGREGQGTPHLLKEMGKQYGFDVFILDPVVVDQEVVSSTMIRQKYREGDVHNAAKLLGYWPTLEGIVTLGDQRGKSLGFPTANLAIKESLLLPAFGVYAAWAEHNGTMYPAIVNIGIKPTFQSIQPTVEVHIFQYQENLYGQKLAVHLLNYIRAEQRFDNPQQLQKQVELDIQTVRKYFAETYRDLVNKFENQK